MEKGVNFTLIYGSVMYKKKIDGPFGTDEEICYQQKMNFGGKVLLSATKCRAAKSLAH